MQAIGRQPHRAPDGAPVYYERHRPEQTTLYRLVQQHAATFIAQAEAAAGAELPQFVKDEFDAFLECGILAHGFLRLRCGDYGHDKLVAFRATLNKSLAARSALFWAVCSGANPRHSWAMPVVCALQPSPNQGAHTREDLFSMALAHLCQIPPKSGRNRHQDARKSLILLESTSKSEM